MKLSTSALSLFLVPLPALAATLGTRLAGEQIFKRDGFFCSIVNVSSYVNCRSGPGTEYSVVETGTEGTEFWFGCYTDGECIEDNW